MPTPLAAAQAEVVDRLGNEASRIIRHASDLVAAAMDRLLGVAGRSWNRRSARWCERAIRAWLRVKVWDGTRPKRARRWRRRFDRRVVWALAAPPIRMQMPDGMRVVTGRQILIEAGVPVGWLPR